MSNFCEFVDGDMTEEDRKKIDELLIKIDEENKLLEKTGKLEEENARLREALELIAKSNFYFARGEEDKQLSRVCEIARNALNGNEK